MKRTYGIYIFLFALIAIVWFTIAVGCGSSGNGVNESATQTVQAVWNLVSKIQMGSTPTLDWGNCTANEFALIQWDGKNAMEVCGTPIPPPLR